RRRQRLMHYRRAGRLRVNGLDDDAVGEAEVGVLDVRLPVLLALHDRVEVAPLRRGVVLVEIDGRGELAIEDREAARRNRTHDGDGRALDDVDAQRVGNLLLDGDALDPRQRREVVLHDADVDFEQVQTDVARGDLIDGLPRRVHRAGDLDVLHRELRRRLRLAI